MPSLIAALLEAELITKDQLEDAKAKQLCDKKPIHHILVEMGFIEEEDLLRVASKVFNIPIFDFDREKDQIDPSVLNLITYEKLKYYGVFPIRPEGEYIILATSDPNDIIALDDLKLITKKSIKPVLAQKAQIDSYIEKFYNADDNIYNLINDIKFGLNIEIPEKIEFKDQIVNVELLKGATSPIVKLLNFILSDAIKAKASDIHIEPQKDVLAIRYRIDGDLVDITKVSAKILRSLVARIKIISDLDIAETRTPQDGRTSIRIGGRTVDLRISSIPTIHGEKVEIRILDPKEAKIKFDAIGLGGKELSLLRSSLQTSQGMILVTGPTGSGKTSTLYASLSFVMTGRKNIITIEDPVEYLIDGINQIQINPVKDVSFANGLRSILRQDPDVILVGEIRDKDTAEIAFRASMTGHLVLSTLHTNNAVATISRLLDIGLEPYLISASVMLILAQRLVKQICPYCKTIDVPDKGLLDKFSTYINKIHIENFFKGKGCPKCNFRGYLGRTAIFETLKITDKIRSLINDKVSENMLFFEAKKEGMVTMAESGMIKVSNGTVALEEIAKVVEIAENDEAMEQPHKIKGDITVLVAEDEEDLLKILEKNLSSAGYRVIKARDGVEMVKLSIQEKPDLIISDVTMPKMSGFEAVKELRSRLETASIPIMLLTARDDKESELKGIDVGADDYIPKPCDHEKLLARIKMLLRRKMW